MAAPDGRAFRLLVCAPMPLGTSWTRAEYRRYLMGLGIRPVPSVGDIGALLESYAAKRCGVHRGVERGGAVTYGTNAHRAREVLASGRPLRPPPKRRAPRRRPLHTFVAAPRLAGPSRRRGRLRCATLLTGTASHLKEAYKAGYARVMQAPSSPEAAVVAARQGPKLPKAPPAGRRRAAAVPTEARGRLAKV